MADTAANVALAVRRYEVARFTIAVTGIDLTGVPMNMQVRPERGTPGPPFIQLGTVATASAEGLKLDSVTVVDGVPTSIIKGRINQTTMSDDDKVPYSGEMGSDTVMAYAMQWTLGGDARTRIEGEFTVRDSAYGSDNAPLSRPPSYCGGSARRTGASSGSLTFGDQVVRVSIADIDLAAPAIAEATRAAAEAVAAAEAATRGFPALSASLGYDLSATSTQTYGSTAGDTGSYASGFTVGIIHAIREPALLDSIQLRLSAAGTGKVQIVGADNVIRDEYAVDAPAAGLNTINLLAASIQLRPGDKLFYRRQAGGFVRYGTGGGTNAAYPDAALGATVTITNAQTSSSAMAIVVRSVSGSAARRVAKLEAQVDRLTFGRPALRQVATRCFVPNQFSSSKSGNGESIHYNRSGTTLRALAVVFANWIISTPVSNAGAQNGTKHANPGAVTYTASIEYPIGSGIRTLLTWDGGAVSKVAAGGATITSDHVPLLRAIPEGDAFKVINHQEAQSGIVYTAVTGTTLKMTGDFQFGAASANGTNDVTPGGIMTGGSAAGFCPPLAILGTGVNKAALLIGDSLVLGQTDVADPAVGNSGIFARRIGQTRPYIDAGVSGDRAQWFLANGADRAALAAFCDTVYCDYGNNDLYSGGRTAEQLETDLAAVRALFPTLPFLQSTITMRTGGSWGSAGAQTVDDKEPVRDAVNTSIAAASGGITTPIDVAGFFEDPAANGKWRSDGQAWTSDGIHPNAHGYAQLQAAGVVPVTVLA